LRKSFCIKCFKRTACNRPCKIVRAELRSKGIYEYKKNKDTGKTTTALKHKKKEVKLRFESDMQHMEAIAFEHITIGTYYETNE